jgi:hypothetical protein
MRQKETPHDAISKNADLGNDHHRVDCVRDQQLGPCVGPPLGRSSLGYQIVGFGHCRIPAWVFAAVSFAPYASVAHETAHIDA